MKILKFLIPAMVMLTFSACIIDRPYHEDVNACFTVSGSDHYVNEPVYFVNCSQYAYSYEWDFGDGFSSNQRNPIHTFSEPGNYQVRMTAYGDYDQEDFTDVISVGGSTDLDILVMFEGTSVVVPDCEVTLYGSYDDWLNFNNPLVSGYTNNNGVIVFTGLGPYVYFIDGYLQGEGNIYYSNDELGIETAALVENTVNEYNIYLRQYTSTKGKRIGSEIVKIEKSSKEEHERIIIENQNK
jgi:PKD repeat protein